MDSQAGRSVLLVRPASFGFNPETAASNAFANAAGENAAVAVLREFDAVAQRLIGAGVEVLVLEDAPDPPKPDAIFPNNWVSFHADGTMVLYPMESPTRRREREPERLATLLRESGFDIRRTVDLSHHERHGRFLEGTGSLVLDRPGRRAFANLSPRTDPHVIADFDDRMDYATLLFDARDRSGMRIYHTNVLLSLGTRFAVLCTEAVAEEYRTVLIDEIEAMPNAPYHAPMPKDRRLLRVCRAILEDPSDQRDLDDWAQVAGMGRRTFTRLFREETGMGLAVWRQQVRLMEALSLLASGRAITTVAFDVGYESPSAFTAMFHRAFGVPPSQYRVR